MSQQDDRQVQRRASLLPEERRVGSDDARKQAEVILEDSEFRTDHPAESEEESSQTLPHREG